MPKNQLNTKSIARIAAIQVIYQFDTENNHFDIDTILLKTTNFYKNNDIKSDYELDNNSKLKLRPSYTYLKQLVKFTHQHLEGINIIIQQHLTKNWRLDNLPKLLSATLRVAICEIKYFPKTPRKVILNEYTDIVSDMLDEGEIGFVNSILNNYAAVKR